MNLTTRDTHNEPNTRDGKNWLNDAELCTNARSASLGGEGTKAREGSRWRGPHVRYAPTFIPRANFRPSALAAIFSLLLFLSLSFCLLAEDWKIERGADTDPRCLDDRLIRPPARSVCLTRFDWNWIAVASYHTRPRRPPLTIVATPPPRLSRATPGVREAAHRW